jgi:phenylalanyl-tRNA synthetase beta chain
VELTAPEGRPLDAGLLSEAIRFQELLHATIGLDRRLASFGLYAVDRLKGPVRYRARPAAELSFVPLDASAPVDGVSFLREHPMALRYGALGATAVGPLVLEDADGAILSLPPILNAEGPGSVRPGDRSILLESTGQRPARVADGLGLLMLPFVAAGWTVTPVPVDRGSLEESGDDLVRSRPIHLTARQLAEVAGISLSASEVVEELSKARLPVRAVPGGWEVLAPPWRPDLLQAVDLIEDTILARGVRIEDGLVPPSPSRGRRRPETRFRESVGDLLLGAGYVPLHTPVLIPLDRNDRVGRTCALRLVNPVSEELGILRDSLLPSLLGALGHNVRHGYPQGLSEIGPVIVADAAYETGGRTRWHAGFVRAGEGAGFADVAARVDAVVRAFGALGVREPVEIPGIIPGRGAILRIAGETVAEMGELRPELLDAERIPVAVAYGEIDLSMLWPLVRAAETD